MANDHYIVVHRQAVDRSLRNTLLCYVDFIDNFNLKIKTFYRIFLYKCFKRFSIEESLLSL